MTGPEEIYKNIIENLIPFHPFLGFKLEKISDGFAQIRVPFKQELVGDPRSSAIHGGVIATAMDSVGGAAAMTTMKSFEDKISTIDMRVDYLRPGKPMDLIVEGEIVRSGNRIVVTRMVVYQEDRQHLVAEGKAVYNVKRITDKS
jgi:uncharacterized protein (TIGR00369 family)